MKTFNITLNVVAEAHDDEEAIKIGSELASALFHDRPHGWKLVGCEADDIEEA